LILIPYGEGGADAGVLSIDIVPLRGTVAKRSSAQPIESKRSVGQLSLSHQYGVAALDSHKYAFYNQRIINNIQIYLFCKYL
jgi:hypothetical protein